MLLKKLNLVLCILLALVILGQLYMVCFEPYYLMTETTYEYPQKLQDEGKMPYPREIGLFEMIWLKFHSGAAILGKQEYGGWGDNLTTMIDDAGIYKEYYEAVDENGNVIVDADGYTVYNEQYIEYKNKDGQMVRYKSADEVFEQNSNLYVMGVVGITALGLVVLIMTIFTRKSIVLYCFTVAWCAVAVWGLFIANNPILTHPDIVMPYELGTVLPTMKVLTIVACVLTAARAYPFVYERFLMKKKVTQ